MTPAMMEIKAILEAGAASAMTIEQIIQQEIKDWLSSELRSQMLKGEAYYHGETDILRRKRTLIGANGELEEAKHLANNKLIHNFARKLADQKISYLLGKPLTIQTNNTTYQERLKEFFGKETGRLLKNAGKESINKGKGWVHVYYDEEGKLSFQRIPSEEVIPFWRDGEHTKLDALIRVYDVEAYEGTTKKILKKVEFWNLEGVTRYIYNNGELIPDVEAPENEPHFFVVDDSEEKGYNWKRVPFICFKYNDEELPLLQFLKSLVDDYDKRKSDNSNNLEDLPNSIYVVKGFGGADAGEIRKNLSTLRIVKIDDPSTGAGVDTISLQIDTEAYKTHMEINRKDIYEFGRGVDTQVANFGSAPSGVALRFLYSDLDLDASMIETEFQASLEQLLWFIDTHLYNTTGVDYSGDSVTIVFNRDMPVDESSVISDIRNSVDILSDETLVAQHPYVTDVQAEFDRLKKQKAEVDPYDGLGNNSDDPSGGAGSG